MERMLGTGVGTGVRGPDKARRTARHHQVALHRVAGEKVERHTGQIDHGKHIQLEQLPVDLDVDRAPLGPLRASRIVHQNVDRFEVVQHHVEVIVVVVQMEHIHL